MSTLTRAAALGQVDDVISKLAAIRASFEGKLVVQPSASLQHVPYDATVETKLPSALRQVLAFAFQKLKEVDFIARLIKKGTPSLVSHCTRSVNSTVWRVCQSCVEFRWRQCRCAGGEEGD